MWCLIVSIPDFCPLPYFAIILKTKRKLIALLLLSYKCIVTINVMWLFLEVLWVGLQCVSVAFPDHTHLLLKERLEIICIPQNNHTIKALT